MTRTKWNEESIRKAFDRCSSITEFKEKFGSAYNAAARLGIRDDLFASARKLNQWPKEAVLKVATESKSYTEF